MSNSREIGNRPSGWVLARKTTTVTFQVEAGVLPDNRPKFLVINGGGNIGAGGVDARRNRVEMFKRHEDAAITTLELSSMKYAFEHLLIAPHCHSDQLEEYHVLSIMEAISETDAPKIMILIGTRRIIDILERISSDDALMERIRSRGQVVSLVGAISPIGIGEGDARSSIGAAFAYMNVANPGEVFMSVHLERFDAGKVQICTESGDFVRIE